MVTSWGVWSVATRELGEDQIELLETAALPASVRGMCVSRGRADRGVGGALTRESVSWSRTWQSMCEPRLYISPTPVTPLKHHEVELGWKKGVSASKREAAAYVSARLCPWQWQPAYVSARLYLWRWRPAYVSARLCP